MMLRWRSLAWLVALLFVMAPQAAFAGEAVKITLAADGVARVSTSSTDATCAADRTLTSDSASLRELSGDWRLTSEVLESSKAAAIVDQLLRGAPIYCGTSAADALPVTTTFAVNSALLAAEPAVPNGDEKFAFAWYGWSEPDYRGFLEYLLQGALTCKFMHAGATLGTCRVGQVPSASGGRALTFSSDTELTTVTQIVVTHANGTLALGVVACDFQPAARLRRLYKDASQQVLGLTSNSGCIKRLMTASRVVLVSGEVRVDAEARALRGVDVIELDVRHVPAALGVQKHVFTISSAAGSRIGSATVEVRERGVLPGLDASNRPRLAISFDDKEELDRLHSQESVEGIAVTSFSEGEGGSRRRASKELYVHNTLELQPEDDLRDAAQQVTAEHGTDRTEVAHYAWQLRSTSSQAAWLYYETPEGEWWDTTAGLDELSRLTFAVFGASPSPLTVSIELVDTNVEERTVLYGTRVEIAKQARAESLPLQIQELLYIICGDDTNIVIEPTWGVSHVEGVDIVRHGQTRAVDDADLTTGQCKLVFDSERLWLLTGSKLRNERRQVLRYFGPQDVHVTMSRAGEVAGERIWRIDPTKRETLALPYAEKLAAQTGPYIVRATLNGLRPPDVVYRPQAATAASPTSADRALGALEFVAGLRLRGHQGWTAIPIRTFVTIPLDLFGYRLPADPRTLATSSDSPHIQGVSLKAGIALVVEPWSYDTGSNPWPVPLRLLTGFHLFDLSREDAAPSFVTGVSVAFPLLELPDGAVQNQLGTDLTVSAYWEMNLEQQIGHHFLLAFGANFLSLFGSK